IEKIPIEVSRFLAMHGEGAVAANRGRSREAVRLHYWNDMRTNRPGNNVRLRGTEAVGNKDCFLVEIDNDTCSIELLGAPLDAGLDHFQNPVRELKAGSEAANGLPPKGKISEGEPAASADARGVPVVALDLGI